MFDLKYILSGSTILYSKRNHTDHQETFISTMHYQLFTALLAILVTVGFTNITEFDFIRRTDFDGLFCTTQNTMTLTTRTRLHCAKTCAYFADSSSFFFNSETRECSCMIGVMTSNETCQVSPATVYYAPRGMFSFVLLGFKSLDLLRDHIAISSY